MMGKYKTAFLILLTILLITINGCSSMFAHMFGSDHLKDKKYRFLLFDNEKSKVLFSGYMEIKNIDYKKFSGEFRIIDVLTESIPIASGILEGKQLDDKEKASMTMKGNLSEEKINVSLDKTWNLMEGSWSYKSLTGKFVAFDYN